MKKLTKALILVIVAVMLFGTVYSSAAEPYVTYTYSIDGEPLSSPHAYSAIDAYDSIGMKLSNTSTAFLDSPSDIVTDSASNVYIADKGNNRIVVLNQAYEAIAEISSYVDENGRPQQLSSPNGLYVTDENKTVDKSSYIFVCDTGNKRIVVFDRQYNYVRTIVRPESPVLSEQDFKPYAIAVDIYGRIFVVSEGGYDGVIVLSNEGGFTGFIGSQKVTSSLIDTIWRRFMSKEQRAAQEKKIPVPYNNITVDDDGFVYVTTNTIKLEEMTQQFNSIKTKDASYSPVKKLNSQGVEIVKRNGFFDPGGEVDVTSKDVSQIYDVAIGNEGSWTILDNKRSRFFTYDQNGNLLFAFGDEGVQLGSGTEGGLIGICYQIVEDAEEIESGIGDGVDYRLIALDRGATPRITVYEPTDYCDTIMDALHNENVHNYSESQRYWEEVLTQNNNFDLAYIGIGKALYNLGKYEEAQEMLASAYETTQYSKAFAEIRKQIINDWLILLAIAVVAILVLGVKFLGYAKKKNKITSLKVGKKTYWEELLYVFHLIFHPFDGFWDLKHEKRGSVRAATTIIGITIVAFFYQSVGRGYTFNPREETSTIFMQIALVGLPLMLWCIANWCLTTLFDGEGSFRDIYIAAGYAIAPLPFFVFIATVFTNILTVSEGSIVTLLLAIGYVWVGLLLYFGMMVTHDYSLKKNFVTVLGTILAMLIILFIAILFFSLIAKMITFIVAIFSEIGNRM